MTMTEALSHVREGFSPKLIKQAIGIASDKRYAGGNMSGAVDAIEKLQKGLSDHPQVMAVLKRQNEDVDMQEGRMKELHHHIKMGKSAKEIAKIMKLDFKTINALVDGLTYEEVEEGTESLDEAFSSWTVTILKTVNKIKKGDSKSVKAQNVAQALKKAAKAWGDDNLNSMPSTAFKVTKDTSESVESVSNMSRYVAEIAKQWGEAAEKEDEKKKVMCEDCGKVHEGACAEEKDGTTMTGKPMDKVEVSVKEKD